MARLGYIGAQRRRITSSSSGTREVKRVASTRTCERKRTFSICFSLAFYLHFSVHAHVPFSFIRFLFCLLVISWSLVAGVTDEIVHSTVDRFFLCDDNHRVTWNKKLFQPTSISGFWLPVSQPWWIFDISGGLWSPQKRNFNEKMRQLWKWRPTTPQNLSWWTIYALDSKESGIFRVKVRTLYVFL